MNRRRVLLVGATGAFGRRLAELLARDPGLELVLAARTSRSLDELAACLRAGGARAAVATRPFERERPEALAAIAPWLVVDAAGPFQEACGYTLVLAAVSAGAHYVDLADGRDFVSGFQAAVGPDAVAAGVSAVTGASSTPALSHAALERLTAGWSEIESVRVVISPGARAPRGLSVVRAILSYAGRPVRVFQHGGWVVRSGWSGLHRPSMPGLGRRLASLCETPDLDLVPARFAVTREVLFLAGLELPVMHLGLWALALLVRSGVARSLAPLAPTLRRGADILAQLGTDRGGMIVEACGRDPRGQPVQAQWALWAEAGAGPFTPAAPAAALIRAMAAGEVATCGAQVCVGLLSLDTILAELADLPIHTRIDAGSPEAEGLFHRTLGPGFAALSPAVRAVHDGRALAVFEGRARMRAGRGLGALLIRTLTGLPPSGVWPLEARLQPDARGESWTRRFGRKRFVSRLFGARTLGVFKERVGPFSFAFRLDVVRGGVRWKMQDCRLLGLPMPRLLTLRSHARAWEAKGAYHFSVVVAHPWVGLLFAYRGRLDAPAACDQW